MIMNEYEPETKTTDGAGFPVPTAGETKTTGEATTIPVPPPRNPDYLLRLPDHVLLTKVFGYFTFNSYALTSCAAKYLLAHWNNTVRNAPLPLYLPEDCRSVTRALQIVAQDQRIGTIWVGKGLHKVESICVNIQSAVNIVGRPGLERTDVVINGGFMIKPDIQGSVHFENMTIFQENYMGVWGQSSFTLTNVLVEKCGAFGVTASGEGVFALCTDVEVRTCGMSGVVAAKGGV